MVKIIIEMNYQCILTQRHITPGDGLEAINPSDITPRHSTNGGLYHPDP
jgi:hypothetical protein